MGERKTITIYPWQMSSTGSWSPDTGIYLLRDDAPEDLVDVLWSNGIHVQNTAITELMTHGNPRKAAEVARALVGKYPVVEKSIREGFGEAVGSYLLELPLDKIPSKPEEYPTDINIEFIQ